jgi:hypothetical protein
VSDIEDRLEYLRGEIRGGRISYGEIVELQGLAEHIAPEDTDLLEWAGVPEFDSEEETPMSKMIDYMGTYDIVPDETVDLRRREQVNHPSNTTHRHVVVQWEGGEVWLDMSNLGDHYCIDIRQMSPDGNLKGQGYMTIVNGRRGDQAQELEDTAGQLVQGHGWKGGYVATLMTDHHGAEKSAMPPSDGNG